MQYSKNEEQRGTLVQCSLFASVGCGVPVLFTALGIIKAETLVQILNIGFALLGIA